MAYSLKELLDKLELTSKPGIHFLSNTDWQKNYSLKTSQIINEKIKPTAFYHIDTSNSEDNFIFFFEFTVAPIPEEIQEIHKNCWNFNRISTVFFILPDQIQIFNGFSLDEKIGLLNILTDENDLSKFSYWELISGKTWEHFSDQIEGVKGDRVDATLLKNIADAKKALSDRLLKSELANSIIGRLIFTRYLIDRDVIVQFKGEPLNYERFNDILAETSPSILYELFSFLNEKFLNDANEMLFPTTLSVHDDEAVTKVLTLEEEKAYVREEHIEIVFNLFTGGNIIEKQIVIYFANFKYYDFEIIPVEFISNIYELFIGEQKQVAQSSYYTPLFLTEYILNQTVKKYFDNNPNEYNCKVLDPSCGSGIFLVESLRKIINQYQRISKVSKFELKSKLSSLVTDNIFGVDKDPEAINIAIFSIYLTLLDFQEPKDISTFKFPNLRDNFFEGDFFSEEFSSEYLFRTRVATVEFDFVLGNPPWGTPLSDEKQLFEIYCEKRAKKDEWSDKRLISNREIAQAFIIRISDIASKQRTAPSCALIITSKIFYNNNGKDFRRYFLERFYLEQVVELSVIRRQVFDKKIPKIAGKNKTTIGPPSIIFYKFAQGRNTSNNIVKHISIKPNIFFRLFKILVVEKYDYKEVVQSFFVENDWIWKLLVFGTISDFYFIKRLKRLRTINEVVSDEKRFIVNQGFKRKDGLRSKDSTNLIGYNLIEVSKHDLQQFHLNSDLGLFSEKSVAYLPLNLAVFEPPMLLIKEGTDPSFKSLSALSYEKSVFNSSITAIKALKESDVDQLKIFSAVLNSNLCGYYFLLTGSSIGIERDQVHDNERLAFPLIDNGTNISNLVSEIEEILSNPINKNLEGKRKPNSFYSDEILNIFSKLETEINKAYKVSRLELDLIDYANIVSIPLFQNRQSPFRRLSFQDKDYLSLYANVFIDHFENLYRDRSDMFFSTEIYLNSYAIIMHFHLTELIPEHKIKWTQLEDFNIIKWLVSLSFSKETETLFVQKDVKIFNDKSFYIMKPNEFKVWHRALAHLDLGEILEAIINQNQSV
ncbi:HsdM family class I SAM-dependent methyltransferase [Fibrella forsythiae]|uniref:site-specific DNA-methyltransferase (adenine-specific) n=1 Tax=Fibrella forsythiae TaxID=2817061 RepID=A0ABS3JGU1_9BACT|nr:N-6 DNA methylase [Fibrella forsythiae]MBO0949219.1 N-6 DNA methylase [Fibrella forsythiae]